MNVLKTVPAARTRILVLAGNYVFIPKGGKNKSDGGKDREENLMKKILFLGAVAILLSLGLVLVSCGGCPGDGDCVIGFGITPKACENTDCAIAKANVLDFLTEGSKKECDC
jgi:hypothetical protein